MANSIPLTDMPHMLEARSIEDNWAGISDYAVRKKRQNRLNQRAFRRRKHDSKTTSLFGDLAESCPPGLPVGVGYQRELGTLPLLCNTNSEVLFTRSPAQQAVLEQPEYQPTHMTWRCPSSGTLERNSPATPGYPINEVGGAWFIVSVGPTTIMFNLCTFPLPADHLLTLVRYNLYRACAANAQILGLEPRSMHEDIPSPFSIPGSFSCLSLPPSLHPTEAQVTIRHHPYMDLFPFGRLRDNLLLADGTFEDDELCADLGGKNSTTEHTGLVVWGEPWDPMGWEISEYIARKWAWLFTGCEQLLLATDSWRNQRGEPPLLEALLRAG
ncbi:hypothetical protein F5Y19DRAFT_280114 [Xylariaceae sp. FL1651]|nr:hypothetical protein F5Y19DRAFT_280114 [Xylariaceae sp. FL1651]